jgi:hypothetical protein
VILNILIILNTFARIKLIIFVRLTKYLKFLNKSLLRQNKNNFETKKKKPKIFNKKSRLRLIVSKNNKKYLTKKNRK